MKNNDVIQQLEPLLERELSAIGIELVDLEYRKERGSMVLRVFIDKESGVNLDTCQEVSRLIGDLLDSETIFDQSYNLEVSSPGLDRIIKKEKDFVRFSGRRITVRVNEPIEGQKNFTGILRGLVNESILIEQDDGTVAIPRNMTTRVRLVVEI
ncbi:MAG: ribosome maturation factor RimP [Chitinophagales bacterium]